MYPEIVLTPTQKRAFIEDRTGCIVGDGLARRYGWNVGDRIVLQVGIPLYGDQDYTFTVRGIYHSGGSAVDNQSMFFHWKYADERSIREGTDRLVCRADRQPRSRAAGLGAIDSSSRTPPYETKTDTEQQFQSSFVSMFGNLSLLLGSIALAVVITTLFVAGNTMAMSVRERTTEIAVMRTLGFPAQMIFLFIAGEGLFMSLVGGLLGARAGLALVNGEALGISGGFFPPFGVTTANAAIGVGLSALIGLLAGLIPATWRPRLKIVDALRRVA